MVFSIGRGISGVGLATRSTRSTIAFPRATLYQYWHIRGHDTTEKGLGRDRPTIPVTWRVSYSSSTALQGLWWKDSF